MVGLGLVQGGLVGLEWATAFRGGLGLACSLACRGQRPLNSTRAQIALTATTRACALRLAVLHWPRVHHVANAAVPAVMQNVVWHAMSMDVVPNITQVPEGQRVHLQPPYDSYMGYSTTVPNRQKGLIQPRDLKPVVHLQQAQCTNFHLTVGMPHCHTLLL